MAEEADCEIEFLDEDADIVQQCVQTVETEPEVKPPLLEPTLLVERVPNEKPIRRRRKKEDDSDYDPAEDIPQRTRKKRQHQFTRQSATRGRRIDASYIHKPDVIEERRTQKLAQKSDALYSRKLLNIKIPDYDDPLCLPVRATKKDEWDARKLKNWNNLCLQHFKHYDSPLRADKEPTVSSKRTVVLRNIHNKLTGKVETTMYSKIIVENKNENKKSEIIQSVLPKYREKKVLNTFKLSDNKKRRTFHHRDEVLLNKEVNKDVETLVVYKPKEKLSLVYKMFEKERNPFDKDEENKKYLKEVASCKTCAPCYQTSWRGFKKNDKKNIRCQVCMRPCISVYNLLSHLKSHDELDVRSSKRAIARSLASVVEYHYKCRLCQEQFLSIKELRQHVNTHKGTEPFKCEVGSHVTT